MQREYSEWEAKELTRLGATTKVTLNGGFSEDTTRMIAQVFITQGYLAMDCPNSKGHRVVRFLNDGADKLWATINPHIIDSRRYKVHG